MNFKNLIILLFSLFAVNLTFSQVNIAAVALTKSGDPYPSDGMCPSNGRSLQVKIVNNGTVNLNVVSTPVTITINITGPINQSFSTVLNSGSQIVPSGSKYINVTTNGDFSLKGNYTIEMSATCNGDVSPGTDITETLTVEGNKLSLTSSAATAAQTVCLNSSISTITYGVSGNATNATATGLPAGVTASFSYPTLTISGSTSSLTGSPFSFSVTSSGGCPSSEDITLNGSLTVKSLPQISIIDKTNDTLTCNDPLFIFNAIGGNTYSWSTGANTSNITVSSPGKYVLTGTTNGCSNKDSIEVTQNITPPNSPMGVDVTRCGPGTINLGVSSNPNTTVTWYAADKTTIKGAGLNYTTNSLNSTTSYFVEAKNTLNGCVSSEKTEIKAIINPLNTVSLASSTPILCTNTSLTTITHITTGATGIGQATGLPAGVSASWASNTIIISGTPTEAGVFNYTIPLTGGCGNVDASGTITVTPSNTVSLASSIPTLCINTTLTSIIHTTTGATGIGPATDLPLGVIASWLSNKITISGTPTQSGVFNYTIPLTGGCGNVFAKGTIIVNQDNTVGVASSLPSLCVNTALIPITQTTTTATGIGSTTGLPTGVTASWDANTIKISGTPTQSGVFNYSIPLTGGCGNVFAIGTITVNSMDDPSFTYLNTSFCKMDLNPTPNITGKIGGTFTSIPSGLVLNPSSGAIDLSSSTSGYYTITYTTNGICQSSQSIPISIGSNPAVDIISDQTICSGSTFNSINFKGTIGTVFEWTNTNISIGLPASGIGDISSFNGINNTNSPISATINVTPKSGSCSGVSKSFTLTILGTSTANAGPDLPTICQGATSSPMGGSIAGSATGASWTGGTGTWVNANDPANAQYTPGFNETGIITLILTAGSGSCGTTTTKSITVKPSTVPTFTQLGPYCKDATPGILPTTSTNAVAGTWDAAISTSTVGTQTYTFTPTSTGAPTCATTATMSVEIKSPTIPSFTQLGPYCKDATPGILPTTSTNGIAGTWDAAISTSTVGAQTYTFTPTLTVAPTCATFTTLQVVINEIPTVNPIPDQQVCEGSIFNPINFTSSPGTNFAWTNSNSNIGLPSSGSGNISAFVATGTIIGGASVSGIISVTPSIGQCVGAIKTFVLTTNASESALFNYSSNSFCKNQSNPTPIISGVNGGLFSAASPGLVIDSNSGNININASSVGNHKVIYTTSGLCRNSHTVPFTINIAPSVDSISNYTICPGYFNDSIKFKGTTGASFDWTNSNTATGVPAKDLNFVYPFKAQNNGDTNLISEISVTPRLGECFGLTKKFKIIVRFTPQLIINQIDTIVCPGGNINFKTELNPTNSSSVYQWFVNDTKVGVNSAIYWSKTLKNKDKITVNVTSKDFCSTTANLYVRMDSLRLSMNVPTMVYLKAPAINLAGYPTGGTFLGKGIANNKLDPSVLGVGNKMVTYSYKNANNCLGEITQKVVVYDTVPNNCHSITYDTITDTVSVLKIKFKLTTGIKANQETLMRVYPNPTSDILLVEADEKALLGYKYKILDAVGKEVYNQPVKSTVTEISLKSLGAAGTYFFEVYDENLQRVVNKKIILD